MTEVKNLTRYTGIDRRAPRTDGLSKSGLGVARESYQTGGPRGRHAAITNSLYNWHSYKNWADKVRGNWDDKK